MRLNLIALIASVCFIAGVSLLNPCHCAADLVVFAEFQSGEPLDGIAVTPGQSIALDLFGADVPGSTQLEDSGLGGASFRISTSNLQFAGTSADDAFMSAPDLDNANPVNANTIDVNGDLLVRSRGLDDIDFLNGVVFPVFPTDGRVMIGTLNFVVPTDASGSVSFLVQDGNPADALGGSVSFGGFVGFDSVQPFTATISVTSVPEPATSALLVLGITGMAIKRRKRAISVMNSVMNSEDSDLLSDGLNYNSER